MMLLSIQMGTAYFLWSKNISFCDHFTLFVVIRSTYTIALTTNAINITSSLNDLIYKIQTLVTNVARVDDNN